MGSTQKSRKKEDPWCVEEFADIDFGDKRLNKRFLQVSNRLLNKPMSSINKACGTWKESKAAYRLFDNDKVEHSEILSTHQDRTVERMQGCKRILVIQDTCFLNYNSHFDMEGLGPIGVRGASSQRQSQGLVMHTAFAIDPAEEGLPIGILDQMIWAREPRLADATDKTLEKAERKKARAKILKQTAFTEKESYKWVQLIESVGDIVPSHIEVIHVCDREADINEFFLSAHKLNTKLLVRAKTNRALELEEAEKGPSILWEFMESKEERGRMEVRLPHVSKAKNRLKQEARTAIVAIRASKVKLKSQTKNIAQNAEAFEVNVVFVKEVGSSKQAEPIEWMLLTHMEINDYTQILDIIQCYKKRWHIENYHRVLKSGCQIEQCQLENTDRLERFLGLKSIVAWRLYWMSRAARVTPDLPCGEFLTEDEQNALYMTIKNTTELPDKPPTIYQAIRWIAQLGGFLARKGDGEPGIISIWDGWEQLMCITASYRLFRKR